MLKNSAKRKELENLEKIRAVKFKVQQFLLQENISGKGLSICYERTFWNNCECRYRYKWRRLLKQSPATNLVFGENIKSLPGKTNASAKTIKKFLMYH